MTIDERPTELNRDVWQYVEIDGHTIAEAMEHFNLTSPSIYRHIKRYRDGMPLPDDYVHRLRNRAKRIADKALDVIESNLDSDKPDMHTAIQTAKGTGAFVEKQEIETSLVVHDSVSPEERFRQIRDEWAKRNLDFHPEVPDSNTTSSQIPQPKTVLDFDIDRTLESAKTTSPQISQSETDTGQERG